jgi:DNA-binding CsgD family transcriptional regulator
MSQEINKQFGKKTRDLLNLIDTTPDWEQYVTDKTAEVVKMIHVNQSMQDTMDELDMKYTTVRSHLLRAFDRISEKRTDFRRGGKSDLAQELFDLMDNVDNWEAYVTNYEAQLAQQFRDVKNFYELGRQLSIAPGNIAGTLYGTTQKVGVIGKIKEKLLQSDRRDFSILGTEETLGMEETIQEHSEIK